MKSKIIFLLLLFYYGTVFSQKAIVQSFKHAARWVSETNFPNFIPDKTVQDTILLVTSEALKRKFNVKEVILPNEISYKYYGGFGKPEIIKPQNPSIPGDYNVAVLSFITRDTYSLKVYWNIEIVIQQNGQTTFSNKKTHELEYYSPSSVNPNIEMMSKSDFIRVFAMIMNEMFDDSQSISDKIIIGSRKTIDDSVSISIPNALKLKMITKGNFLSNNDFSICVEDKQVELTKVVYRKGKATSRGKANFGGWLFATFETSLFGEGSSSSYMKKTHEVRNGSLEFSNGEIHQLKMDWIQNTEKEVVKDPDGSSTTRTGYSEQLSPMKIVIVKNDSLYGNLTYFKEGELYVVEGKIQNHLVNVSYAPITNLLRVIENNETIVIVEMQNVNPDNLNSFAGNLTSQRKFFSSSKSKLPEWYTINVAQNINQEETINYMEAVFCLFFGLGNHY